MHRDFIGFLDIAPASRTIELGLEWSNLGLDFDFRRCTPRCRVHSAGPDRHGETSTATLLAFRYIFRDRFL